MERPPTREYDQRSRNQPPPYGEIGAPVRSTVRAPEVAQTPSPEASRDGRQRIAANTALGAWLFVSAFLWQHNGGAFTNTVIVGALLVIGGLLDRRSSANRLFNVTVAVWLVLSTLVIVPHAPLTFWHNLVIGIAALLFTLLPAFRARGGSTAV